MKKQRQKELVLRMIKQGPKLSLICVSRKQAAATARLDTIGYYSHTSTYKDATLSLDYNKLLKWLNKNITISPTLATLLNIDSNLLDAKVKSNGHI